MFTIESVAHSEDLTTLRTVFVNIRKARGRLKAVDVELASFKRGRVEVHVRVPGGRYDWLCYLDQLQGPAKAQLWKAWKLGAMRIRSGNWYFARQYREGEPLFIDDE